MGGAAIRGNLACQRHALAGGMFVPQTHEAFFQ